MFGLGIWELLAIFLVVLLLFGAKRLPEIGGSLGKGIREFKDSVTGVGDEVKDSVTGVRDEVQKEISGSGEPGPAGSTVSGAPSASEEENGG